MDKHAKNPIYLQTAESDLEISFCTDRQLTDTQLAEMDADPEDHEYLLLYDDWKLSDDTYFYSTHFVLSE